MSNGIAAGSKRNVDAAFGEEGARKSKKSKSRHSKPSTAQLGPISTPKTVASSENAVVPQKGPSTSLGAAYLGQTKEQKATNPAAKSQGERKDQDKSKKAQKQSTKAEYTMSAALGGRFANHDPILVSSDEFLIVAVRSQLLLYSTATSLLVRSLRIDERDTITSYITCGAAPNCLFLSTYAGTVLQWDWATGQEVGRWQTRKGLLCISQLWQDLETLQSSGLLLLHESEGQNRRLTRAALAQGSDHCTEEKVLLDGEQLIPWIKVLDRGRSLVLCAGNKLLLGQASGKPEEASTECTWREVLLPQHVTSIDVRSHHVAASTEKKKRLATDIVVGCKNGSILVYDDFPFRLTTKEKNPREEDIVSRRFHWHRNEVSAVKWSHDGNYIISGGYETVMVIWQLDTGQRQFLPHLSAAIQHLTVSSTGSAYVVHLADNSVMVLSATELQPTAYISGLNLGQVHLNQTGVKRIPAALYKDDPATVALAVPADHPPTSQARPKATLLQTYNIRAQQQTDRQALVRNNTTALNVDPSGRAIQEPDVVHLKISHDNKWLATVDEWTPPDHDLESLYPTTGDSTPYGKEIYLKFWSRNETTQSWELVTKIDVPQSDLVDNLNSILDLASSPQRPEFSTISCAGKLRIWSPRRRHRNNLPILDRSGSQLHSWDCAHTVEIPLLLTVSAVPARFALAYSADGSVLATSSNKSSTITFIDPRTGRIAHTLPGSHPGTFSHLAFVGHHVISISKDLRVYNTISGELLYALAFSTPVLDVHLAAAPTAETFAIALLLRGPGPERKHTRDTQRSREEEKGSSHGVSTQVSVFDLQNAGPVYQEIVDGSIQVLLALEGEELGGDGYVIVNDEAETMYLRRPESTAVVEGKSPDIVAPPGKPAKDKARGMLSLEDMFGSRRSGTAGQGQDSGTGRDWRGVSILGPEEGGLHFTHQTHSSLADVFHRSADVPVRDLFEQVVGVLQQGS